MSNDGKLLTDRVGIQAKVTAQPSAMQIRWLGVAWVVLANAPSRRPLAAGRSSPWTPFGWHPEATASILFVILRPSPAGSGPQPYTWMVP